jgi:cytochrome c biogenesis protein CcmG/thiol:disulfide interchange protein DsbE
MPGGRLLLPPSALERLAYGEPNIRIVNIELIPLRSTLPIALAIVAALALVVAGCGSSTDGEYGGEHPDYAKALTGSPAPLAALHRQSNRLLPGGVDAYEERIAALRGYPVVVNVWASWCGPCRFEFPYFQRAAAEFGKRVAFLGVDSQDSDDAAHTFLEEAPVPYPSYTDPDEGIAESVGANLGLPDTAFYDNRGELVHLKQGPYGDEAELRAEIERFALGKGSESG